MNFNLKSLSSSLFLNFYKKASTNIGAKGSRIKDKSAIPAFNPSYHDANERIGRLIKVVIHNTI